MQAEGAAASTNPKITQIVDQVSQLTLLETADLVSSLKVCISHLSGLCAVLGLHWLRMTA